MIRKKRITSAKPRGRRAIAATNAGGGTNGGRGRSTAQAVELSEGKSYDVFDWAYSYLCGLVGVTKRSDQPPIWDEFRATKKLISNQDSLVTRMQEWSKAKGYKIDPTFTLDKTAMEDFIHLRLNPLLEKAPLLTIEDSNCYLIHYPRRMLRL